MFDKSSKKAFSKTILEREYRLLVFINVSAMALAFFCVYRSVDSALPWIAAMVSCSWAAWGASKITYHSKSTKENLSGGLVYEATMAQLTKKETC